MTAETTDLAPLILAAAPDAPPQDLADMTERLTNVIQWIGTMGMCFGGLAVLCGFALNLSSPHDPRSSLTTIAGIDMAVFGGTVAILSWIMGSTSGGETDEQDTTADPTTTSSTPPPTTTESAPPTVDSAPDSSGGGGVDIPWATSGLVVAIIAAIVAAVAVLALLVWVTRRIWKSHKRRKQAWAELAGRWELLDNRYGEVSAKYVDAETNPEIVLDRPIIREVDHWATRKFHTTFSAAQAALERRLDIDYATTCVSDAEQAWSKLWRVACEVGLPGVSAGDRRRAHNLLRRILDESVGAPEREAARRRLDKIIESSKLDAETAAAVTDSVDHALQISGVPTQLSLTKGSKNN